jgi:hypothetical protein
MDSFCGFLLIVLLILPGLAAIVVACLGQGRATLVRQISLGATLAGAVIAVLLAGVSLLARGDTGELKTFQPWRRTLPSSGPSSFSSVSTA